jgi:hypothetical protein
MLFDIIYSSLVVLAGLQFVKSLNRADSDKIWLRRMWLYHLLMGVVYYTYIQFRGGDQWAYFNNPKGWTTAKFLFTFENMFNEQGTNFMYALNYPFTTLLNMSMFSNMLIYTLIGFFAFVYLYLICIDYIPNNAKVFGYWIFPLLLFLPNLHFWSAGIGKDTISFFCVLAFAYGILNVKNRYLLVILSLLLSYGIRPHITLIMLLSFGITFLFSAVITNPQRIALAAALLAASFFILPNAVEFAHIEDISVDAYMDFAESKAQGLSYGKSAVDISSYSYPFKVFTFLYRPLFFDINGWPALVASFENLLLIILSVIVLVKRPVETFLKAPLSVQGLFIFFLMGVATFSVSMSNLGIILRMRNMFLPGMIVFILWSFSYNQQYDLTNKE